MLRLDVETIILMAPVILLALTVHEFCHAWAAYRLGDDTARLQGRLTLNPIAHLDIFGTILFFIAGFGWAKPVPVNPLNLKDPKKDMMFIAFAGPASNVVMALAAGLVIRVLIPMHLDINSPIIEMVFKLLMITVYLNLALAVFNMIPLPPLDGSRILYGILPREQANTYAKIEPYGVMILFAIFIFGGRVFHTLIWYPISILVRLFSGLNF
ncbi:MAG: site-2 protease family protein [Candidatus Dadabacteria bacterium]|nr:site-2 protease family protein [Candidatus Dadabacteria bacterium]